jgi:hypothetical protein
LAGIAKHDAIILFAVLLREAVLTTNSTTTHSHVLLHAVYTVILYYQNNSLTYHTRVDYSLKFTKYGTVHGTVLVLSTILITVPGYTVTYGTSCRIDSTIVRVSRPRNLPRFSALVAFFLRASSRTTQTGSREYYKIQRLSAGRSRTRMCFKSASENAPWVTAP